MKDTVMSNEKISAVRNAIVENVREKSTKALNNLKKFQCYEYIWLEDKEKSLEELLENIEIENDDIDQYADEANDDIGIHKKLQKFRIQVKFFQLYTIIPYIILFYPLSFKCIVRCLISNFEDRSMDRKI